MPKAPSKPRSFRSVIELWPTRKSCADDIKATGEQVSKWWQRDNIPADWWKPILRAEPASAAGVTADLLIDLADKSRRSEARV